MKFGHELNHLVMTFSRISCKIVDLRVRFLSQKELGVSFACWYLSSTTSHKYIKYMSGNYVFKVESEVQCHWRKKIDIPGKHRKVPFLLGNWKTLGLTYVFGVFSWWELTNRNDCCFPGIFGYIIRGQLDVPLPTYPYGKSLYIPIARECLWVIIPKNPYIFAL